MAPVSTRTVAARSATYDLGLRRFYNHVFALMGVGMAITAMVSELIANTGLMQTLFSLDAKGNPQISGWWIAAAVLQFGLVWMISSPKKEAEQKGLFGSVGLFVLFTTLVGVTIAPVLYVYTATSAATVFFITAGTFGGAALWGYTTKTDMSRFSGFLMMGLIGLVVAMVANLFIGSAAFQFAVSVIGVVLFVGLTAWDMQAFRSMYDANGGEPSASLVANAALALYLDFLNLFLFILNFIGIRK